MKLTELLNQRMHTNREPDFSHMPTETVSEYLELRMKESLTAEETRRLAEIEGDIRYKPGSREPHVPQAPWGPNETAEEYVRRIIAG